LGDQMGRHRRGGSRGHRLRCLGKHLRLGRVFIHQTPASVGSGLLTAVGVQDAFLLKINGTNGTAITTFDSDGQLKWGGTDTVGGISETGWTLAVDSTGAVFMAGSFNSPDASFNGGPTTIAAQGVDGYVLKIDGSTGAPVLSFGVSGMVDFGGTGTDGFFHALVDSANDIFLSATQIVDAVGETARVVKLSGSDGTFIAGFGKQRHPDAGIGPIPAAS